MTEQRNSLAIRAWGPHPFPSRTRSLSLTAPMVLRPRGRGRVGRRRHLFRGPPRRTARGGPLSFSPAPAAPAALVLTLRLLPDVYALTQLPAAAPTPPWAGQSAGDVLLVITRTPAELSIVSPESYVPPDQTRHG